MQSLAAVAAEPKFEKVIGVFGNRFTPGSKVPKKGKSMDRPNYDDYDVIVGGLGSISGHSTGKFKFISGGSRGVESLVERWCNECEVPFERIRPDTIGNTVDPFEIRNTQIISKSTEIIIFWDGNEIGFDKIARVAILFGKPVRFIPLI